MPQPAPPGYPTGAKALLRIFYTTEILFVINSLQKPLIPPMPKASTPRVLLRQQWSPWSLLFRTCNWASKNQNRGSPTVSARYRYMIRKGQFYWYNVHGNSVYQVRCFAAWGSRSNCRKMYGKVPGPSVIAAQSLTPSLYGVEQAVVSPAAI